MAAERAKDKQYNLIVANANALYKRGDYSKSKFFYVKANALKPGEKVPLDGLDSISARLLQVEKSKANSTEYAAVLTAANQLAYVKKWDSALAMYTKAMELRPQEDYPPKAIKYVQSEIDRLKTEAARRIAEATFLDAMSRGETAVKEKRFEDALANYNQALGIHPENTYARDRAKILAYQISLQKTTE